MNEYNMNYKCTKNIKRQTMQLKLKLYNRHVLYLYDIINILIVCFVCICTIIIKSIFELSD